MMVVIVTAMARWATRRYLVIASAQAPLDHTIAAADGRELAATTWTGTTADVVVVAGATGVPRRFYTGFAQAVAERGPTVITFDYRGMGESRQVHPRREPVRMREWGTLDIEGVLRHVEKIDPARVLWVGQSAGGVFLPLASSRHLVDRMVTVSVLSGYWRAMVPRERVRLSFGWYVAFPVVSGLLGYVPGRLWGGQPLPPGIVADWSRWCRDPDYFFGDPTVDTRGFDDLTAPILALRATDDPWATLTNHRAVHERFARAVVQYVDVRPDDLGVARIGHIDLLRGSIGAPAWSPAIDWLLADDVAFTGDVAAQG
jgi:predicted alpha/beta hydrolase